MPPRIRLPNRTIWALEDIGAMCRDSRRHLTGAIDRAAIHQDLGLMTSLARLSTDLAGIERLATDARSGRYHGTAKEDD